MSERTAIWGEPRDPVLDVETCCWPECGRDIYDLHLDVPLCTDHFIRVGDRFHRHLQDRAFLVPAPGTDADDKRKARREEIARVREEQAQVYYVRIEDYIKIGYTTNLKARLSSLRIDDEAAVLATEPGGRELEHMRHREFAALRIGRRENFRPGDRLMRHIEHVREVCGSPTITTAPALRVP